MLKQIWPDNEFDIQTEEERREVERLLQSVRRLLGRQIDEALLAWNDRVRHKEEQEHESQPPRP